MWLTIYQVWSILKRASSDPTSMRPQTLERCLCLSQGTIHMQVTCSRTNDIVWLEGKHGAREKDWAKQRCETELHSENLGICLFPFCQADMGHLLKREAPLLAQNLITKFNSFGWIIDKWHIWPTTKHVRLSTETYTKSAEKKRLRKYCVRVLKDIFISRMWGYKSKRMVFPDAGFRGYVHGIGSFMIRWFAIAKTKS